MSQSLATKVAAATADATTFESRILRSATSANTGLRGVMLAWGLYRRARDAGDVDLAASRWAAFEQLFRVLSDTDKLLAVALRSVIEEGA